PTPPCSRAPSTRRLRRASEAGRYPLPTMLLHVPRLLTTDELAALRETLAAVPWSDGRATSGAQSAQAKNNEQVAQGRPELPGLQQTVLAALSRHPLFFSAAL